MPYADPLRRKQFQREYKARWRKKRKQEQANPLLGFKIYICPVFPYFRTGREQFNGGFLVTNDPAAQAEVERHPEFAKFIFPLLVDTDCTPTKCENE